jgi:hypothetical protein
MVVMQVLYAARQAQRERLEAELLAIAGEQVRKLVRLHKESGAQGRTMQSLGRQLTDGDSRVLNQFLAKPKPAPAVVAY